MSGAFEVAAGAFAVVGVADVLIRSGREVYSFLCNIEDAPATATRLCDSVAENIALAGAARRCLVQLHPGTQAAPVTQVTNTLNGALKALDREVKSLKTLIARCKGNSRRWSNIRYALSEQRINKAIGALERAKSLLTSALTLANRELTAIENEHIEELVQQSTQQTASRIGDMAQKMSARLDAHEYAVSSHLDTFRQENMAARAQRQRTLNAKLDLHHQEMTRSQNAQTDSLAAIQRAQARSASRQQHLLRTSAQVSKRTVRISRDLREHRRLNEEQHQMTRDLIVSTIRPGRGSSGRQIVYFGEGRNLIMPSLDSIEKDLHLVFEQLFTNHSQEVSPSHIAWLQAECQHLIASASQEKASLYPGSTATPFDSWIYPSHTNVPMLRGKQRALPTSGPVPSQTSSAVQRKGRKRDDRVFSFKTSKGTLQVRLPYRKARSNVMEVFDEASLSYDPVAGEPFLALHARFTRISDQFTAPRICAQLQIFLPIGDDETETYGDFIESATIPEFDQAVREGAISPYRLHRELGLNVVMLLAANVGRVDILEYLESQGVGYCTLQQEFSVSMGIAIETLEDHGRSELIDRVGAVLGTSSDPSRLLANLVMTCLLRNGKILDFDHPSWSFCSACLRRLHMINSDIDLRNRNLDLENWQLSVESLPGVVQFLLDTGADCHTVVSGQSLMQCFLVSALFRMCKRTPEGHSVRKQVLSALMESGADVSHRDGDGDSVADYAWGLGHWDVLCEALEEHGKPIMKVDKSSPQGYWEAYEDSIDGVESDADPEVDSVVYISEDEASDGEVSRNSSSTITLVDVC